MYQFIILLIAVLVLCMILLKGWIFRTFCAVIVAALLIVLMYGGIETW